MKLLLTFTVLAAVIVASWAAPQAVVELTESQNDVQPNGAYKFSFKQSDGQSRTEEGTIVNEGAENQSIVITGSFSWVGPDGITYTIDFKADENGFQPTGAHIPVAPQ